MNVARSPRLRGGPRRTAGDEHGTRNVELRRGVLGSSNRRRGAWAVRRQRSSSTIS